METLREVIATLIFIIAITLVASVVGAFNWGSLIAGIACFVVAYFVWPSKNRGYRDQGSLFLDILEFVIELPVELFIWMFRLLGKVFSKDGGLDIDL